MSSATLLAKCPGCKKDLRIPEEWSAKAVRCKHCGMVSQANLSRAAQAKRAAANQPAMVPTSALPAATKPQNLIPAAVPIPVNPARPARASDLFAFDPNAPVVAAAGGNGKYRPRRRGWLPIVLAFGFLAFCLAGSVTLFVVYRDKLVHQVAETTTPKAIVNVPTEGEKTNTTAQAAVKEVFPRRLLGISVNNYLYANPISYGTDPTKRLMRDFGSVLTRFADKLKISKSQVYELSDGAPGDNSRAPLKPIIEQTITQFVQTSRAQDHIILIFVGHSLEIDGKPYLVPLEGDLEDAKTLIPLEWVLKQLADCKAQQKILIADLNRYDLARGVERPNGGKLAAKTEEMLKSPPPGVQVVCACSKDQYSYEFDDYAASQGFEIKGGAFLSFFLKSFEQGLGFSRPGEPIPIDMISERVIQYTKQMFTRVAMNDKMESVTEIEQVPFLAGAIKGEPVAFNAEEALPEVVDIPTPDKVFDKGTATKKEIQGLIDEIDVPPVKPARNTGKAVGFASVVPFSEDVMRKYRGDATIRAIMADADKYPLRVATLNAVEILRKVDKDRAELPDEIRSQQNDAAKAAIKNLQKGPARIMADLKDAIDALEKAGEERKDEKSKRWQANFDYVMAQVKSKYAYMHEYSLMAGQVRRDALPELDKNKGQTGWRLASNEKLQSNNDVKEQAKEARKLMAKIVKDYPGTPWEVLAKRERYTTLGLEWVPTNFGSENVTGGN